jgi:hypothetical protein
MSIGNCAKTCSVCDGSPRTGFWLARSVRGDILAALRAFEQRQHGNAASRRLDRVMRVASVVEGAASVRAPIVIVGDHTTVRALRLGTVPAQSRTSSGGAEKDSGCLGTRAHDVHVAPKGGLHASSEISGKE